MFHVEQLYPKRVFVFQSFRIFILVILGVLLLAGCNRKDPSPELVDPLYLELEKMKKSAETDLKTAEEAYAEAEGNMAKVQPQTGQIKYATKRLNESKARVVKAKQLVNYYGVKYESRKWSAREEYLKAYYDKTPWPVTEPLDSFKLSLKLSQNEREWSAKKRREELGFPNVEPRKKAEEKAPAAAAPPAH